MPEDIKLTDEDFLNLSDKSYLNQSFAPDQGNWEVIGQVPNSGNDTMTETGYSAVAFRSPTGEIVIAHRGSDPIEGLLDPEHIGNPRKDWPESNAAIVRGEVPPQFNDADNFTKEIMELTGSKVTHTGHSLGGALAQLSAHKNGGDSIAFENPGVGEVIQNNDEFDNEIKSESHRSILVQNSFVSSINSQIGEVTKIAGPVGVGDIVKEVIRDTADIVDHSGIVDKLMPDRNLMKENFNGHGIEYIKDAYNNDGNLNENVIVDSGTTHFENIINENGPEVAEILLSAFKTVDSAAENYEKMRDGIDEIIENAKNTGEDVLAAVNDFVKSSSNNIANGIDNIVEGSYNLTNDIRNGIDKIVDEAYDAGKDVLESVKNRFNGNSTDELELNTQTDSETVDYINQMKENIASQESEGAGQGIVLPDELPQTGANIDGEISDAAVQSIAAELESNINMLFSNLEKFNSTIEGI